VFVCHSPFEWFQRRISVQHIVAIFAFALYVAGSLAANSQVLGKRDGAEIVTVRLKDAQSSKQGLPIFPGISGKTTGAKGISMTRVVIPPKASANAHIHKGYETAVYLVQGKVETRYGAGLRKSVINVAGDFIFIPANVPHQPRNLSDTEPAIAIVARTDANEQESVELYKPTDK
jgi:uncharacterized RmlC-like cupin family protein